MAPPSDRTRNGDPRDRLASGDRRVPGRTEILILDREAPGNVIPDPAGADVRRVESILALRSAMRLFQRGVIAIAMPPATLDDLDLLADARIGRQGIRILVVNDPADAAERLRALTMGFDGALPASVGPVELEGRMTLLGARAREDTQDRLPIGASVELDLTARAIRRSGRLVRLRPMEFRLLEELARNAGRPLSRDWLMNHVWGTDDRAGSRTVDVHMRWLRAKVEHDPERPEHLLTVRGVGYQLELGTEVVDRSDGHQRPDRPLTSR